MLYSLRYFSRSTSDTSARTIYIGRSGEEVSFADSSTRLRSASVKLCPMTTTANELNIAFSLSRKYCLTP